MQRVSPSGIPLSAFSAPGPLRYGANNYVTATWLRAGGGFSDPPLANVETSTHLIQSDGRLVGFQYGQSFLTAGEIDWGFWVNGVDTGVTVRLDSSLAFFETSMSLALVKGDRLSIQGVTFSGAPAPRDMKINLAFQPS